ncbi:anthranilate phosphoribosyltransferase [Candidatus Bipolaricaulota bacterium]|nr:anthranilate phosphoribosyltransferase [Candidatus Bipolaricaulota bacterium]
MTIQEALARTVNGDNLTAVEAEASMELVMNGEVTAAQLAGFLVALRLKGESVDEIAGFGRAMQKKSIRVVAEAKTLIDVCGTGGDSRGTFNISTTVGFVAAGAGLAVAKHGNRSVSSRCGSADVLEALGVQLNLDAEDVGRCIDKIGIGFLFAPNLHPAMKHAVIPRKEMGIRTVFNVLGPLTNPARAHVQLLGVYDPLLTTRMAKVLRMLGCRSAFVVHGGGGLDELSTLGMNRVARLADAHIETYDLDPTSLGLAKAELSDLEGGDATENARIMREVLSGQAGPKRDIVLLNASAILVAAELAEDLQEGLSLAAEVIDSGAAMESLDALIAMTQRIGGSIDS